MHLNHKVVYQHCIKMLMLFSHTVVSDSLPPQWLEHARPPCPSPSPRACSNSYTLSKWCHSTISSSVVPLSCLKSFPASGSFPMGGLFESGDQSIGASALASVLPMNIQDWFSLGLTGLISLQSKGLSRVFCMRRRLHCQLLSSHGWSSSWPVPTLSLSRGLS